MNEAERGELERQLATARRLAVTPVDDLTKERLQNLVRELEERLGKAEQSNRRDT
jgi:hypothetical protein